MGEVAPRAVATDSGSRATGCAPGIGCRRNAANAGLASPGAVTACAVAGGCASSCSTRREAASCARQAPAAARPTWDAQPGSIPTGTRQTCPVPVLRRAWSRHGARARPTSHAAPARQRRVAPHGTATLGTFRNLRQSHLRLRRSLVRVRATSPHPLLPRPCTPMAAPMPRPFPTTDCPSKPKRNF